MRSDSKMKTAKINPDLLHRMKVQAAVHGTTIQRIIEKSVENTVRQLEESSCDRVEKAAPAQKQDGD